MVKTRNQIINELLEVNIDFDEASRMWKENKWDIGGGTYRYRCMKNGHNGAKCISKCLSGEEYCRNHIKFTK